MDGVIPTASPVIYPLACKDADGWHSDGDFQARGGTIVWMAPDEYLARVRPLDLDENSWEAIDDLKAHIENSGRLDPLKIYADGKEDGRHRAHAALQLNIAQVPVIVFEVQMKKGSANEEITDDRDGQDHRH